MNEQREAITPVEILDEETSYTLVELCRCSGAESAFVERLVEEGIIEAQADRTGETGEPLYPGVSLRRTRVSLRLTSDLGVNLAGAAVALELLERIESLRSRLHATSGHRF